MQANMVKIQENLEQVKTKEKNCMKENKELKETIQKTTNTYDKWRDTTDREHKEEIERIKTEHNRALESKEVFLNSKWEATMAQKVAELQSKVKIKEEEIERVRTELTDDNDKK